MADLRIDLAAEFRGRKAFKEADKAVGLLDKAVGKLGKQIASVFAAQKIYSFGKESVKAFIADERAATQLATAVKNLGLAFAQPEIDNYLMKLESSASIVDDKLRPAFQALLTTTGSLAKSQELLNLAIEGSRGSGIELTQVATDLAQAYVGNTRGLRKYNLGLTQAQLKTASFTDIQKKFQQQFSGANQAYLATYAGKLDVLAVAADNAKETIGKGLVDALTLAAGKDDDIQTVADAMGSLSRYTADSVRGVGVLLGSISKLNQNIAGGFLGKLLSANFKFGLLGQLSQLGAESRPKPRANRSFMGGAQVNLYDASAAAEKKFRDQQIKLGKQQVAAQKALTAEQKKQAALKKAQTMFDLEQIGIIAALKGNISEDERKRLELQLAILTGNEKEASALTYQLALAQGLTVKMAQELASLPMANNPFAAWKGYLDEIELQAKRIASLSFGSSARTGFETLTPTVQSLVSGAATGIAGGTSAGDVYITVQGSVLSEQDLISAVQNGLQFNSLAGKPSDIGRIAGMFG